MPEAGWYVPDDEPGVERWWDGEQWTDHRREPQAAAAMPPPTDSAGKAARPWYKKKRFLIPGGLLALFIFVGIASDVEPDTEPIASDEATEEEAPEEEPTAEPSAEPSEEPPPLASEAEVEEEPEEVVESEEEYELTEEDMRTVVFPIVFESNRDAVIDVLEDNFVVESVDRYVYDGESGTVLVSITPAFDYDEGVRDDAWEIMRGFAEFYNEDSWVEPTRTFIPSLDVDISTANYRCDAETMIGIAESRVSRSDWEASCRVS